MGNNATDSRYNGRRRARGNCKLRVRTIGGCIYGGGLSQRSLPNPNPFLILIFELMSFFCLSHCWYSGAESYFWCFWINTNFKSSAISSLSSRCYPFRWLQPREVEWMLSALIIFFSTDFPFSQLICWSVFISNFSVFAGVCVSECVCLPTKVVAARF